ncbi:MAG: hypothetical protein LUD68_01665 [Rikenellaceae bacterium]|nr:hypothetical protein [Rikenellaceae bacterium]
MKKAMLFLVVMLTGSTLCKAQTGIPDPLIFNDGTPVVTVEAWTDTRRAELFELFTSQMYGRSPEHGQEITWTLFDQQDSALDGLAVRQQFRILWNGTQEGPYTDVLLYLPAQVSGEIPLVVGLNFDGNHTVDEDPDIRLPEYYYRYTQKKPLVRGSDAGQWPIREILARGYGVATAWRSEVSADSRAHHLEGIRSVYPELAEGEENWATVAAWAWGLNRIADLLSLHPRVAGDRICLIGFSRLGKAALWAGATNAQIHATVSVCSGAGGAKLLHRNEGEKVQNLVGVGYWFCRNFSQYAHKDTELPFDAHMMMSLIAPRALYVASASEDLYADPPGEYAALQLTCPVYQLLGYPSRLPAEFPAADNPVGGGTRIGYHVRTGKHDITAQDWKYVLDFLDRLP